MILYFSGTGNSAYVARRIAEAIDDRSVDLFGKIREADVSELQSERPWVIVAPTYAWRMPRLVESWLGRAALAGSKDVYFVLTCGGSIGNAGLYLQRLCEERNLRFLGCAEVVMPENYVAMFPVPTREEALDVIGQAEREIARVAAAIGSGERLPRKKITLSDRLNSGLINRLYYPLFVHAKKFYATDACIGCGTCVRVCPLANVRLERGRPVWNDRCTHCMACICRCPTAAVEYGRRTKGKPRYLCPKDV